MSDRANFARVAPEAYRALNALSQYVKSTDLEPMLLELVKLRASYINGCAYCIDMHSKDARVLGETEQRIYAIPVWRETPFFTPRERAALAWTEAVTEISKHRTTAELYAEVRGQFEEKQIVELTMSIIAINGWNRLAIPFHSPVGTYQPPTHG
ncbi:MAG TPA: carboxymuconolactone decarboxylase family protein [Gemmatimonadaceae bacterium]|jgi:AhpD family alkylhydroperoxidase